MHPTDKWSRRRVLRAGVTSGLIVAAPKLAAAGLCARTGAQPEGPFYMNTWDRTRPVAHYNDLTWAIDPAKPAAGEVVYLTGQVTDLDCKPLAGAIVEIWQACSSGRYAHFADPNPAWLDPNFRYFGEFVTDAHGRYDFKTIKPGPYPVGASWTRPAHVHFKISAGLSAQMLTTQMYFAGDPHLGSDRLLGSVTPAERERLVIEPTRSDDSGKEDRYAFDIRLAPLGV